MSIFSDNTPLTSKERKNISYLNWIMGVLVTFASFAFVYKGVSNYQIYSNAYERPVSVVGNAKGEGKSGPFYLRVRIDAENFPAISSQTLLQAKQTHPEKWVRVSQRLHDTIRAGEHINIEYTEKDRTLYVRYADNHMPDWMYFVLSILSFLFLRHLMGWQFPMQYFRPRKNT